MIGAGPRLEAGGAPAGRRRYVAVDLFAGAGGASEGIRRALGTSPILAVNHDEHAIASHSRNHGDAAHALCDVAALDPVAAVGRRPVDLLWGSPDCFPAGTLVLTAAGYRPIEEIREGDLVLTHRNRWRAVTATMTSRKALLCVRGHGHPGLRVSAEHPFWVSQRGKRREVQPAAWVRARDLQKGMLWGAPKNFAPLPVPPVPGRGLPDDERLWWLAGRYLADGWTRETHDRAELVITVGAHKLEAARAMLDRWPRQGARSEAGEVAWSVRHTRTAAQLTTSHRGLVTWLREHFGHLAHGKRIPGWALGMKEAHRCALLQGYLAGDGYEARGVVEATSTSAALIFGLAGLAASLGGVPSVYPRGKAGTAEIEGRTVSVRDSLCVRWRQEIDAARRQHHADDDTLWTPIREVSAVPGEHDVYNLSVEEDETYVVEGRVVHNCRHFSRAKGGTPRSPSVRALAWNLVEWASALRPALIGLENVPEFQTWGPLDDDGQPIKERAGETYRAFVCALESLGYRVDARVLCCADYGAPTIRRRLFLLARRGAAPVWPEPTHGPGRALPWRTAAECIDWSLPIPSIFGRPRPLADATLRRIAAGVDRYVLRAARPFLVCLTHGGRLEPLDEPARTITTARRGERALISPSLVRLGNGEAPGQRPRTEDIQAPLHTVVAGGGKAGLVAAFLSKHYTGAVGASLEDAAPTVTSRDHTALTAAHIVKLYGTSRDGAPLDAPAPTVTAGGGHVGLVAAFLLKYYSEGGQWAGLDEPAHTIVTKARLGLVTVEIDGEPWALTDIGMRMLEPRELARAQGFPDTYEITGTKEQQIARIGNAVPPQVVEALVRANIGGTP